jgi:methylthioribulose-1-phosphate dehydratase
MWGGLLCPDFLGEQAVGAHSRKRAQTAIRFADSHHEVGKAEFLRTAGLLAELGQNFYARGWLLGTSGNFSALVSREPLRLAITATSLDKGRLTADQIVIIGANGQSLSGIHHASAESALHVAIVQATGAGAVLHTHSVWSTLLSDIHGECGGFWIEGYEMLKGLEGVSTHEHREWIPIIENSQDCRALAQSIEKLLSEYPATHAILLRRHGLYTWGRDLSEAKRHVEIMEFLLEVAGRTATLPPGVVKRAA